MRYEAREILADLGRRYAELKPLLPQVEEACLHLVRMYENKGQLLLCGNGGSAADCEHIAGELQKSFLLERPLPDDLKRQILAASSQPADLAGQLDLLQQGLPALPLVSQAALSSAIANDQGAELVFAQQVMALGRQGDILLAISTSGNAANVNLAVHVARGLGIFTIGLSGAAGGRLKKTADICLCVPAVLTPAVQELHLPLYHAICAALEAHFFG